MLFQTDFWRIIWLRAKAMFKKRCIFGEYERNPPKYIVNVMWFLMISVRKTEICCDGIMNGRGGLMPPPADGD